MPSTIVHLSRWIFKNVCVEHKWNLCESKIIVSAYYLKIVLASRGMNKLITMDSFPYSIDTRKFVCRLHVELMHNKYTTV